MNASFPAQRVPRVFSPLFCSAFLLSLLLTGCTLPGGATPSPTTSPTGAVLQNRCTAHTSTPVQLAMSYGSEKQQWIDDVVADFNTRNIRACDGPISVKATPIGSGDSLRRISEGKMQPDIWSPAGSVWLPLLQEQWQQQHGRNIIETGATDVPSLVTSPIVIAMWKPEAEALGWPNTPIGWNTIAQLSTNPQGWAAYGHPEFGAFKFGHTHPDYSNSGLDAVIAEHYAATNKVRGLTVGDVAGAKDFVANVESSVIHYEDSTGFFAQKMFADGPSYLSAAVMYESLVVEANDGKSYPHLPYPVVSLYPKEGTFSSDHPFAILQADWVTAAKKTSALAFRSFLLAKEQQQKALRYGFRPADTTIPIAAPLDSMHGVDAGQPKTLLQVPNVEVIKAIKASWNQQRRKVDVMLILDRSGSMNDAIGGVRKIEAAKQGIAEFVGLLGDSDGLGITTFSDTSQTLTPVSALGAKRQNVLDAVKGITAAGNTRLFNTIDEQVRVVKAQPSKHIKAVIVLTDGMDNYNLLTVDRLVSSIAPAHGDSNAGAGVQVYTIAYGGDADVAGLTKIADATGGKEYTGNPQNIQQVYQLISVFF